MFSNKTGKRDFITPIPDVKRTVRRFPNEKSTYKKRRRAWQPGEWGPEDDNRELKTNENRILMLDMDDQKHSTENKKEIKWRIKLVSDK